MFFHHLSILLALVSFSYICNDSTQKYNPDLQYLSGIRYVERGLVRSNIIIYSCMRIIYYNIFIVFYVVIVSCYSFIPDIDQLVKHSNLIANICHHQ